MAKEEKEFTQQDMEKGRAFAKLEAENKLLKLIVEQKLKISLRSQVYIDGSFD